MTSETAEQTDQRGDELEAVQQADGRDQIHTKRERNEQRHTHGGGHARDRAQQNAAQSSDKGHKDDLRVGPDSSVAGKKQIKIHSCAPSLDHVHQGAQEIQRPQRDIDGKHLFVQSVPIIYFGELLSTPPFRLFPCRKKPIFMHLQHRYSSPRTFPQPAFQSFYFPFLRYRGFLQQFAFFHANAPKLHIQNTQFWRRSFKKIRAAPAAISSETVPQLYFPPKRAEWYCHKAAQPFCIVLTSLFLLITIL